LSVKQSNFGFTLLLQPSCSSPPGISVLRWSVHAGRCLSSLTLDQLRKGLRLLNEHSLLPLRWAQSQFWFS
jgi:hypothetical protein